MSESYSTSPAGTDKSSKPNKPSSEYPLTAHPAGYWCKKIRGKLHYLGKWEDPDGGLRDGPRGAAPVQRLSRDDQR
jgi:hypothetical protein